MTATAAALATALKPRRLTPRSIAFDLACGLLLTIYLHVATYGLHPQWTWTYVVQGIAVALRRTWTGAAVLLTTAVAVTSEVVQWPYPLGVAIIIYTIANHSRSRRLAWTYALITAVLLIVPSPYADPDRPRQLAQIVPETLMLTLGPLLAGLYNRQRAQLIASLAQRTTDAEQRRALDAQRVRAEERNQLAGELHDTLAHTISLMIVHSGALTLTGGDPRTRELAEQLRTSGTTALDDLRHIVTVLRQDHTAPLAPISDLSGVPALLDYARTFGLDLSYDTSGDLSTLPGTVQRTAYLIIDHTVRHLQQHDQQAHLNVGIAVLQRKLDITLTYTASQTGPAAPAPDLDVLQERISLLAGTLTTDSSPAHGWTLRAELPV